MIPDIFPATSSNRLLTLVSLHCRSVIIASIFQGAYALAILPLPFVLSVTLTTCNLRRVPCGREKSYIFTTCSKTKQYFDRGRHLQGIIIYFTILRNVQNLQKQASKIAQHNEWPEVKRLNSGSWRGSDLSFHHKQRDCGRTCPVVIEYCAISTKLKLRRVNLTTEFHPSPIFKACDLPLEVRSCEKLREKSQWCLQFLHDNPLHCTKVAEY